MITNLCQRTVWAAALLGAAGTTIAGPIQQADVPAEPSWALHIDCDALRPTAVGQYILAEMEKPESQGKLAAFQTIFSFDPRKQLHGLTLYNTGSASEDAVTLVYADFDSERLVTLVKAAKDAKDAPYKKHVIYNWVDEKKQPKDGVMPRTYVAIHGSRVVVMAPQEKRVAQALDVLDQATPNLSASKLLPPSGAPAGNGIIEAFTRKLDIPDSNPTAAILKLAKLLRLRVVESSGKMTATLSLEANNEEVAKQATSVVQGLLAVLRLQSIKPETSKLAEALSLKQDGVNVVATLAMPSADVVNLLKADAEKKEKEKSEKN
jgi:hypothetical protein